MRFDWRHPLTVAAIAFVLIWLVFIMILILTTRW